jgi:hypothetical protein
MKVKFAMNGSIKIILVPENATEEALVKDMAKSEIESHLTTQSMGMVEEVIPEGSLIIKTK